jgi:hypothetical protein
MLSIILRVHLCAWWKVAIGTNGRIAILHCRQRNKKQKRWEWKISDIWNSYKSIRGYVPVQNLFQNKRRYCVKLSWDWWSLSNEATQPSYIPQANITTKFHRQESTWWDDSRVIQVVWAQYSFVGACGSNPKSIDNPPCLLQHSPPSPVRNLMAQQQKGSKFKETSISLG